MQHLPLSCIFHTLWSTLQKMSFNLFSVIFIIIAFVAVFSVTLPTVSNLIGNQQDFMRCFCFSRVWQQPPYLVLVDFCGMTLRFYVSNLPLGKQLEGTSGSSIRAVFFLKAASTLSHRVLSSCTGEEAYVWNSKNMKEYHQCAVPFGWWSTIAVEKSDCAALLREITINLEA